jgi:hypothetical protein
MFRTPPDLRHAMFIVLLGTATTISASVSQNDGATRSGVDGHEAVLAGDWRGDSICLVRESACHDEDSLYHFSKVAGKPGAYSLRADKIVNGQPENMGTLDCMYDAKAQALDCVIPGRSVLRFTWEGKEMRGAMTLTDKTPWRKLALKKVGG